MPGAKFSLESVSRSERAALLDAFARDLEGYLGGRDGIGGRRRRELMAELGERVVGRSIDARQFDAFLRALFEDGVLQIQHRLLSGPAAAIRERSGFRDLQDVTVVGGYGDLHFARAAAKELIETMFRIGAMRKKEKRPLNIGIVSGGTIGVAIRAARDFRWDDQLGLDVLDLPQVRVFPLNVSLSSPDQLAGNATILAFELADKINAEVTARLESSRGGAASHGDDAGAQAYGLSAPLLVRRDRLHELDLLPQTFDVVRHTEPYRVRDRLRPARGRRSVEPGDTELDIVVTGVGELPMHAAREKGPTVDEKRGGSTFYRLAREFEFPMDEWIRSERIVGDIAYIGIRADGTPVPLRKPGDDDGSEVEYLFYTAAELPVLERMAADPEKAVILMARHLPGKYAIPALFASIAGERHRYASHLVTDEETAKQLLHY